MKLNFLPKIVSRSHKRVGRGIGSGKGGHTSGRGQKGQKTRGKIPLTFEGTKIKKSLLKRLPVLRGKGKFKPLRTKIKDYHLSISKTTTPVSPGANVKINRSGGKTKE